MSHHNIEIKVSYSYVIEENTMHSILKLKLYEVVPIIETITLCLSFISNILVNLFWGKIHRWSTIIIAYTKICQKMLYRKLLISVPLTITTFF